jgi:hypothetical protein
MSFTGSPGMPNTVLMLVLTMARGKRTLRHFGYPPDMQKLATDLVLRQAEMLAGEMSGLS